MISDPEKSYFVLGTALSREFETYKADFDAFGKGFELIIGNRW